MKESFGGLVYSLVQLVYLMRFARPTFCRAISGVLWLLVAVFTTSAAEPLRERIDKAIEANHSGPPAPLASDADFLRRVHLDLVGATPTADAARAFLDDSAPDKRAKLVERLLASPAHARHLATVFDVMLMERRAEKHIKNEEWRAFLFSSFATNKPLNQLAREILGADGSDEKLRPAARFYLDREAEPHLVTRDLGRIFFGMDLQCAQCHDHPRIDDYFQRDYHALLSFVNRSGLFTDEKAKRSLLTEKADGDTAFASVFTKETGAAGPRLPGGTSLTEPIIVKGAEWLVAPVATNKAVRPIPKHSRRELLAQHATDGTNRAFNRNFANRLWALLLHRGLVHPVDEAHSGNPAAHPALLDLLADELVTLKFDTRAFLRELVLTRTYQRSIELPATLADAAKSAAPKITALDAEHKRLAALAVQSHEAVEKIEKELRTDRLAGAPIPAELTKTNAVVVELKKLSDAAAAVLATSQQIHSGKQEALKLVTEAFAKTGEAAAKLSGDKPLTDAAAVLKTRATLLTNEVATASSDVTAKQTASKAATDKHAAGDLGAKAVQVRLDALNAKIKTGEQQHAVAVIRRATDRQTEDQAKRAVNAAKTLVEHSELTSIAAVSQALVNRIQNDLTSVRPIVAKQTELTAAEQAQIAALAVLAEARKQLAAKEEASRLVGEVLAKAELAQQKLTNDTAVAAVATQTKTRHTQIGVEITGAQQVVAGRDAELKATEVRLTSAKQAHGIVGAQLPAALQRLAALETELRPALDKLNADRAKLDDVTAKLGTQWGSGFAVGSLAPLTPEQFGWSLMQTTGLVDAQRAAAEAEFDKKTPPDAKNPSDPARLAERVKFTEQFVHDKLKGNLGQFVSLFGGAAGGPQDDFYATPDQALFFANGGVVRSWLAPTAGNLTDRLTKLADAKAAAEELYLAVLTRRPSEAESAEVQRRLAARPTEKLAVAQELAWALLAAAEFRFNH